MASRRRYLIIALAASAPLLIAWFVAARLFQHGSDVDERPVVEEALSEQEVSAIEKAITTLKGGESPQRVFETIPVKDLEAKEGPSGGPVNDLQRIYCLGSHTLVIGFDCTDSKTPKFTRARLEHR